MEMRIVDVIDFFPVISVSDYRTVKNFDHIRHLVALSSHQLLLMTDI